MPGAEAQPMTPEIPGPVEGSVLTAFRCGLLHATGAFDLADLSGEERAGVAEQKSWFWLGEAVMSAFLAGIIAVPAGCWFATRTELPLAVIGAAVLFLSQPIAIFQATAANRPALEQDSAGRFYMRGDGVNDYLQGDFAGKPRPFTRLATANFFSLSVGTFMLIDGKTANRLDELSACDD